MRLWRWLLLLFAVAALAAFGWHWVAVDPGYVLVRYRGVRIESTLIVALALILVGWAALTVLWHALRWPFGALSRRHRRLSRKRFSEGLLALAEGRYGEADRALARAARLAPLRAPALLASAEAAHQRGEPERALEMLDEATQDAPQAARVLRARILRRQGRADDALALLVPEAEAGKLPPAGWRELAEAALLAGRTERARGALEPLRQSGALGARGYADLETRVLAAAIAAAPDAAALNTLWAGLGRAQRQVPTVIAAYARAASRHDAALAAMDEVESALRRGWDPLLVAAYGDIAGDDLDARLKRAESWLAAHPNDAVLLTALGRICVRLKLWGKAQDFLERAVALEPSAAAWETLGDACTGQGDPAAAARCYRNAMRLARGEPTEPLSARPGRMDTRPIAVEERDEHGVPRLPGFGGKPAR